MLGYKKQLLVVFAEALRQKRLEEMHASASKKQHLEQSGYGCVKDVNEDDLMVRYIHTYIVFVVLFFFFS